MEQVRLGKLQITLAAMAALFATLGCGEVPAQLSPSVLKGVRAVVWGIPYQSFATLTADGGISAARVASNGLVRVHPAAGQVRQGRIWLPYGTHDGPVTIAGLRISPDGWKKELSVRLKLPAKSRVFGLTLSPDEEIMLVGTESAPDLRGDLSSWMDRCCLYLCKFNEHRSALSSVKTIPLDRYQEAALRTTTTFPPSSCRTAARSGLATMVAR